MRKMSEALFLIVGMLVGGLLVLAFMVWGAIITGDRAVKLRIWSYNGKAYVLKEVEPNE
jgi:hypothetical protein